MAQLQGQVAAVTSTTIPAVVSVPTRRGRGRPLVQRVTPTLPSQPLPTQPTRATLAIQAAPMEEEEYTTQFPQTFHHGLPQSNLELGTFTS